MSMNIAYIEPLYLHLFFYDVHALNVPTSPVHARKKLMQ